MKSRYKIEEYVTSASAGCDCCTDFEVLYDILDESNELIDGMFLTKEEALLYIMELHDIEVRIA